MPITQRRNRRSITETPRVLKTAAEIIDEREFVSVSRAADAFSAQDHGYGQVPPLYLCTYGGDRRVVNVERKNANTYRVVTRTDGLMLGKVRVYRMFGGHPLLREDDVSF